MSLVGLSAPDFALPSTKNLATLAEPVRLGDYRGRWLVLFFYPLDFTFVCPTEVIAFHERFSEFTVLNAAIVGVSRDSPFTHRAWITTPRAQNGLGGTLRYPLASDLTLQVCRSYGVLIKQEGIALRGLFLIDPEGVVQYEVVHNLNVGRN
ncbi:MAG: peroxiredoxin, partial [Candidatus Binatia bacterium]|nr:peroxiredoxin [Candidatus Binatia bacterium]